MPESSLLLLVWRSCRIGSAFWSPFSQGATPSGHAYFWRKDAIPAALAERFPSTGLQIIWRLNNLDGAGRGSGVYLTLTGTSAEDADSGQVGRGNRANG